MIPPEPQGSIEHTVGLEAHASETSVFIAGQVLAERYRILRFIAQGGMGEVYEAEDRELGERIALKTVRPQGLQDGSAGGRFRREIQLARKVTHPNVCRIFELGHHQESGGERVLFLTMELLAGETLAERLRRDGRLAEEEAGQLLRQMAEALGAAHEVGVVHRDFKSQNVMLVPKGKQRAASGERRAAVERAAPEVRAVVTDFGLARRSAESADTTPSLTGAHVVLGTPATMAPEQILGEPVGPETDIYALGIVLYEMLTGVLPFQGPMPGLLHQRLFQDAPSPRRLVPDLDARWEAAILKCLARKPADRFRSTAEMLQALETGSSWATRKVSVRMRRSIGVLGFKNLSGRPDAAWLSTAFSEMLSTELASGEQLRIASGENVAQMKLELALGDADSYGSETLQRIRRNLGVELVVFGSYLALGGQIRLDLRLQDAEAGETLALVHEKGAEAEFFELVSRAGDQLRRKLGLEEPGETAAGQVRAALPSQPEAVRLYAEGLARLRAFDYSGARNLLEAAVVVEPGFALAHVALADAWNALGYEQREKHETGRAVELSAGLSREERLVVEARHRMTTQEGDKAVELYGALFTFFPDNVDYGLRLSMAQKQAHRRLEALATIQALRRLPLPASEDLRIDIREIGLEIYHRDAGWVEAAARRAAAKAEALGTPFLLAAAWAFQGTALRLLGEVDQALAALETARRIYAELGNTVHVGKMILNIGYVLKQMGFLARARQNFESFLELCRQAGFKSGERLALHSLGNLLFSQRDLAGACRLCEETEEVAKELGDLEGLSRSRMQLAGYLFEQGELTEAKARLEDLLSVFDRLGSAFPKVGVLGRLGLILRAEGKLQEAQERFDEAAGIARRLGDTEIAGLDGLNQAKLCLEKGQLEEARAFALLALPVYQKEKSPHGEAAVYELLAESFLAEGRVVEAQEAIEGARALYAKTDAPDAQFRGIAARVQAASGQPGDLEAAIAALEAVLEETARGGFVAEGFELRLALGELELRAGRAEEGRARLEALEQEAAAKGFHRIAHKAAAALRSSPASPSHPIGAA